MPVATFLECFAGIKYKMSIYKQSHFTVSTSDMQSLYYFHSNIRFKLFANNCILFEFKFYTRVILVSVFSLFNIKGY